MNEMFEDSLCSLHNNNAHHMELLQSDACIQDYYEQRQAIIKARTEAIQLAVSQIEQKYSAELWQLEQEYGVYVSMITPQKDS